MNTFKRGDEVLFQGESYTVVTTDGLDVLIQSDTLRLRVDYRTIQINPWS